MCKHNSEVVECHLCGLEYWEKVENETRARVRGNGWTVEKFNRKTIDLLCENNHCWSGTLNKFQKFNFKCKDCGETTTFSSEKKVSEFIKSLPFDTSAIFQYAPNWSFRSYRYDLAFPKYKVIVEIDGEQHFRTVKKSWGTVEEQRERDVLKDIYALKNGWSVMRIDERCIADNSLNWKAAIMSFLNHPLGGDGKEQVVYLSTDKFNYNIHSELLNKQFII